MDLLQRSLGGFLYILAPFRKASISIYFATFKHPEASQKLPKSTLGAYKRVETTQRRLQGGVGEGWERFLASFWTPQGSSKLSKSAQSVLRHVIFSPSPNSSRKTSTSGPSPTGSGRLPCRREHRFHFSTFPPKGYQNDPLNTSFSHLGDPKITLWPSFAPSYFRTDFWNLVRTRAEAMGECCLPLTAPGPLPPLI